MSLSESNLQKAVIGRAQELGWKVMHPLPGQIPRGRGYATTTQGDGKGYPDLTLVRERLFFVELKAEGKYLSAEQKMWRDWILAAGGEWHMWKPKDWFGGEVDRVLAARDESIPQRLIDACGGDMEQASRIHDVSTRKRETAPPR